ncbi:phosphoglycerate mutase-like protein [Peniophora sp. CONT]|nr:phosphoglycerate mutase-like protein [Peniophora sp. CONT]
MAVKTVYILRHGFRLNWLTTDWKSPTGLPRDPPLAAFGETQAKEVADYFLSLPEDERPTAIFSSPYYRCIQTIAPTAEALGVPIFIEHGLSEWYSPVEAGTGLHPRPGPASSLERYNSNISSSGWQSVYLPSRLGEDVPEFHDRASDVVRALIPLAENNLPVEKHERILFMSHAATVIALARALSGQPELPFRAGCASITVTRRKEEGKDVVGAFEIVTLGSGKHLKDGLQRDWGFEDIQIADGKVVNDKGVPGTEDEDAGPSGLQVPVEQLSRM